MLAGVARAVGAELGTSSPLEALAEYFGDDQWLLILDNLEQVVAAARDLDALLARCRDPGDQPHGAGAAGGVGVPGGSAPTATASRVLPIPPSPVRVTNRTPGRPTKPATSSTASSRPTSEVASTGSGPLP